MGNTISLSQWSLAFIEVPLWLISYISAISEIELSAPGIISKVNLLSKANRWPERKWWGLEHEVLLNYLSVVRNVVFIVVGVICFTKSNRWGRICTCCSLQLSSSSIIMRIGVEFMVSVIVSIVLWTIVWSHVDTRSHIKTMFLEWEALIFDA